MRRLRVQAVSGWPSVGLQTAYGERESTGLERVLGCGLTLGNAFAFAASLSMTLG